MLRSRSEARAGAGELCLKRKTHHCPRACDGKVRQRRACRSRRTNTLQSFAFQRCLGVVSGVSVGLGHHRHVHGHCASGQQCPAAGRQRRAGCHDIVHQQNPLPIDPPAAAKGPQHVARPLCDRQFVLHPRGPVPRERRAVGNAQQPRDLPRQLVCGAGATDRPSQLVHRDGHDPTDIP